MKKLLFSIAFLLVFTAVIGQVYQVSDNGSSVAFVIKNIGANVNGKFSGIDGSINFNAANLATASVVVKVAANTIFTDNNLRDKHLKKEDYFNVDQFTILTFSSTKIAATNKPGMYNIDGTIIIKGVAKAISFPFEAKLQGADYFFTGSFKLNRRDFNVGGKSWVLSDNLVVNISLLAKKK